MPWVGLEGEEGPCGLVPNRSRVLEGQRRAVRLVRCPQHPHLAFGIGSQKKVVVCVFTVQGVGINLALVGWIRKQLVVIVTAVGVDVEERAAAFLVVFVGKSA